MKDTESPDALTSTGEKTDEATDSSLERFVSLLARWRENGDKLIEEASVADTWEKDAELRSAGCTLHSCAQQLEAEIRAGKKANKQICETERHA